MNDFGGMTVNERLYAAGVLQDWDAAVIRKDKDCLRSLLTQVGLGEQAQMIIARVLSVGKV